MSEFDQSTPPEQAQTRRKPPLSQLRLKNWRSLKDVTIDFDTPITVFIGANSSGKSNILDSMKFLRDLYHTSGIDGAVTERGGQNKVLTHGDLTQTLEISFSFQEFNRYGLLTQTLLVKFDEQGESRFKSEQHLKLEDTGESYKLGEFEFPSYARQMVDAYTVDPDLTVIVKYIELFVGRRWQILTENFLPPITLESNYRGSLIPNLDFDLIQPNARNLPIVLDFMHQRYPDVFEDMQQDLVWLLNHVDDINTRRVLEKTQIILHEKANPQFEAPSVSDGTARVLAMIAAYYLLDASTKPLLEELNHYILRRKGSSKGFSQLPGIVIIEEPDMGLNPHLLAKFVELLRDYIDREHPRQFILTTHNPMFLNLFEPEEVRIVERDEQGYTTVHRVPDYIDEAFLQKHGLGGIWLTNTIGGSPG